MLASRHCHMRSKYFWQCYVLCGVLLGLCGNPCAAVKYHIGTYLAESCAIDFTQSVNDTVQRALNVLNERSIATSVDFTHTVFSYCDEATALANIEYVFGGSGHDAVIGIATYPFHNSFAAFSDVYKKPYIASNSFVWTHVTDYAFSSSNSYHQTAVVLGQILDYFKWQGVVSITTDDAYWYDLTTELYIQLNLMNFNMKKNVAFKSPLTHEKATRVLSAIETSEKAVILCMNLDDQRTILSAASNLSIGHKHAFFAFARSRYDVTWQSLLSATQGETDSYRTNTANIMESVFVIAAHFPGPEYTFPSRNKRSIDSTEQDQQNTPFEILNRERRNEDPEVTSRRYLSSIFDSVLVLGYAIENYMNQTGQDIDQSVNIINYMKNISFNGSSGFINVDADSTTMYDYHIYDYSIFSGRFEFKIALKSSSPFTWELKLDDEVLWPSNTILSPDTCYKQSSGCDEGGGFQTVYIVILFIAGVVVVVIGIIIFVCVRRVIARNEMKRGPHKLILQPSDLTFLLRKDMGKGSRVMKSSLLDKPDLVKASEPTKSTMSLNELSDYTDTARFNGDLVHVKELKTKGFEMKSSMMDYMKALRDLRHENINPYVGLLVDPVKPALVTEYCSRGSLQDVIRNEDIKLDWDFKYSLVIDLVRGLRYLHNSSLKWHGYLKSTNCVIDSRWVLKLTDYGLPGFLGRAKQIREQDTLDLLWTAPEYLRQEGNQIHKGSEKGDVYSFAIIMQEVALRSDPYSTTGLAPKEIFRKLKKPPPLIRPSVSPQFAPPPYIQLMKQCWSEAPDMRPGVEEIYDQFKKITSGKKANIVDTMFRMLEKYSNDLEEIVNDRTVQLEEEKKKTDQLLSRMLPPAVAEYLKSGKPVEAETFAEVTIYFSDIVGFTTISAMSTPMQVVDLLNDLYTMFDATIEQYDVYKVETIGDAYMVVSGLPTRIGYKHAGEISTMALDLLSQCGTFKIRHMPDVPLRLRIGLHTGSCVAGVVGLTMPRYCLFGDTVNTASRMESTGSAFRIHVSEETKEVLYVLGGYKLEFRGMTDLKGKGKRPTYWLTGKEGFTKPLPDPPDLSADSHGLASVLSSDSLSTMFNNDSTLPATDRPEPILESNEEEANNSMRASPDQEQTTINFKSESDQEETASSKDNSNSNTPKKSSAACSPKPETKNTTKRPNTPKSRPKSSDVKKSTASEIPLKNIVKAEVTVEKRPTEKQSDQNDKLVNDRLVKQKSPQKAKSEHSSSDTSIAKTASSDKSSSSTQSLSDLTKNNTNHNNNNNNNAQSNIPASISSTNSYPNIPKTDKSRPRTPSNTGGDKASAEPRKLEIVRGKTGPHGDTKNGKNCPEMQPNHVDDVIKSNPKPQNSPGKHSVKHDINSKSGDAIVNSGEVVNKSCDAVQNNDGDSAEQRRSDVTVVSVLSASDIDINADKLEKSPNDIKLKQQQKKMDSSRLPPITQL